MPRVSPFLSRTATGYAHWCPACEELHVIFDRWQFDGNVERPTFSPSVKITGKQTVKVRGEWTGEWVRGPDGKAIDQCCHYFLREGQLIFCGDCTHDYRGRTVPLPELPEWLRSE